MAAVLVHIDLDGARPHASSLQALAAGRVVASSWGAILYAAVIVHDPGKCDGDAALPGLAAARVPGEAKAINAVRLALARAGADKIVVVKTEAPIVPLWSALGPAWQAVLDQLRPRLVAFGADAPSTCELGPRTAARIGARLFLRARAVGSDDVELRDRDGSYVRASDSGADPRVELVSTAPAQLTHTTGTLIAISDDAAGEPDIASATQRLAQVLGAHVVGSERAASAGVVAPGAVIERGAPLAPALCVAVGAPAVDIAGAASLVRVGSAGGKGVDGALTGPIAPNLAELARALEGR